MNMLLSSGIGFLLLSIQPPPDGLPPISLPPEIALGAALLLVWGVALCTHAWRHEWQLEPRFTLLLGRGVYSVFFVGAFLLGFLVF